MRRLIWGFAGRTFHIVGNQSVLLKDTMRCLPATHVLIILVMEWQSVTLIRLLLQKQADLVYAVWLDLCDPIFKVNAVDMGSKMLEKQERIFQFFISWICSSILYNYNILCSIFISTDMMQCTDYQYIGQLLWLINTQSIIVSWRVIDNNGWGLILGSFKPHTCMTYKCSNLTVFLLCFHIWALRRENLSSGFLAHQIGISTVFTHAR